MVLITKVSLNFSTTKPGFLDDDDDALKKYNNPQKADNFVSLKKKKNHLSAKA